MGINLPAGDAPSLPEVPVKLKTISPELYDYLLRFRVTMQEFARGQFSNTFTVATAINSGTSGVFAIASGGHITLSSGIVTVVTTI